MNHVQSTFDIFHSCSPTNRNNKVEVTTSVGFEVGVDKDGISGTFSVSKSETKQLYDWEVLLDSVNNWKFQHSKKFKGYRTSFPKNSLYYSAGAAKHKLYAWPDLTKNTFDFCTMSVFKTNRVLANTVRLPINIEYQPGFIRLRNSWPSWHGIYWYSRPNYTQTFLIDMSQVS